MNEISSFPTCDQEHSEILRDMKVSLIIITLFMIFIVFLPLFIKRGKKAKFLFIFWCNFFVILGFLMLFFGIETLSQYRVYKEDIYDPRLPVKNLKIFLFSDIHITQNPLPKYLDKHINRTIEQIEKEEPDIILFAGDLSYHCGKGNYQTFSLIEKIFNRITNFPTYLVIGNHDLNCQKAFTRLLSKNKTRMLYGTSAKYMKDNQTIYIHGAYMEEPGSYIKNMKFFQKIEEQKNEMKYNILLTHLPDSLFPNRDNKLFDIAFLGHSHGGQVTLRNTLWSTTKYANWINCSGIKYHTMRYGETIVHVSRGLGITFFPSPQIRIGAIPEVSVITIHNSKLN